MSIKLKILVPVGLLGALLIGTTTHQAIEASGMLGRARHAASVNVAADRMYAAAAAWAVERGATAMALSDPLRQSPIVQAKRHEGNQALEEAIRAIDLVGRTPRITATADELAVFKRKADATRAEVDAALRSGVVAEDLRQAWIPTITALVMAGQNFRVALEATVSSGVDVPVMRALVLKAALWRAAEFAGRERAMVAAALSRGTPLTSKEQQLVLTARGEINGSLAKAAEGKDSFGPAFADAYDAIKREYLDKVDPLRAAVFEASSASRPYTVTPDEWFATTTHGIETIFAAQHAASAAADAVLQATVEAASSTVAISIGTLAIALLATAMAAWTAVVRVTRPLRTMTDSMRALADGQLDIEIGGGERRDEVGAMAAAMVVFKANALENARMRAEQEREREAAEAAKVSALRSMAETVEQETRIAVEQVAERTREMDGNAQAMAGSAGRMAVNSQAVAAAAEQALANAQTVAAATEELTAAIREIGAQVAHASTVTRTAVDKGRKTQDTIGSLSEAVNKIGDVSNLISNIASQTNLLALNATIEAARAGDAGKGFAVVANEVKHLASQTAKATEDIAAQIATVQSVTLAAVHAVEDIGGTILEIEEMSGTVAAAMEEQSAATLEISRNVVQTAAAAREVSRKIAEVSDEAQATGGRAGDVRLVASGVAHSIDELRNVLVRVVRTSMSEVDRRAETRHSVDLACRLSFGGREAAARVRDLSEGGAMIADAPEMAAGMQGSIRIEGIDMPLRFHVRSGTAEGLAHIKFDIGEEQRASLSRAVGSLVRSVRVPPAGT